MFYLCLQVNSAIYQLIDDSTIVEKKCIDYNLKKSIKVDSTCYLSCGYFFFAAEKHLLLSICCHISIVLQYFNIIINFEWFWELSVVWYCKKRMKKNFASWSESWLTN